MQDVLHERTSDSDKVHFLTILTSSIYHKFLNADLRNKFFHMDGEVFRFSLSFFLGLPFPIGSYYNNAVYDQDLGYCALSVYPTILLLIPMVITHLPVLNAMEPGTPSTRVSFSPASTS